MKKKTRRDVTPVEMQAFLCVILYVGIRAPMFLTRATMFTWTITSHPKRQVATHLRSVGLWMFCSIVKRALTPVAQFKIFFCSPFKRPVAFPTVDLSNQLFNGDLRSQRTLLNVSRGDVLTGVHDLLMRTTGRNTFKEWRPLNVLFDGQEGADAGGPTREFFRLSFKRPVAFPYLVDHLQQGT